MKIKLIVVGKTDQQALQSLIDEYLKRLKHYVSFEMEIISDLKNRKSLSQTEQKIKEGALILSKIKPAEALYLLDEKGTKYSSVQFANFIQKKCFRAPKLWFLLLEVLMGFRKMSTKNLTGKFRFHP